MSQNENQKSSPLKSRKIIFSLGLIIIGALGYFWYWSTQLGKISTENAYVNTTIVNIAPRITGIIKKIDVKNNQIVKKGDTLYEIDTEPFEVALAKAEATLDMKKALLANAETSFQRTANLYKHHTASRNSYENALASLKSNTAAVQIAEQEVQEAQNNLSYTIIKAPETGVISNFSLGIGDAVHAYQADFALVTTNHFWLDANYKETDIKNIRHGQCASIILDMYPKHTFTGYVESLSYGTGETFSLLPPQNATGNWVKVTRRVPVKIIIMNKDQRYPLRVGASASVVVDTHHLCLPQS